MLVLKAKTRTNPQKAATIDEAIRTAQFIRNKSLRLWMDVRGTSKNDLQQCCNEPNASGEVAALSVASGQLMKVES